MDALRKCYSRLTVARVHFPISGSFYYRNNQKLCSAPYIEKVLHFWKDNYVWAADFWQKQLGNIHGTCRKAQMKWASPAKACRVSRQIHLSFLPHIRACKDSWSQQLEDFFWLLQLVCQHLPICVVRFDETMLSKFNKLCPCVGSSRFYEIFWLVHPWKWAEMSSQEKVFTIL